MIKVKKFRDGAYYLIKSTKKAKAYDIRACLDEDVVILPNQGAVITTGLVFINIPDEEDVKVLSKSGLAANYNVFVLNSPGLIDADFIWDESKELEELELRVILFNAGKETFTVKHGMKIAQAEASSKLKIVDEYGNEHVEDVERTGGFGSTGLS